MPRYSTASGSEGDPEQFPSPPRVDRVGRGTLNSTPRFQLPFDHPGPTNGFSSGDDSETRVREGDDSEEEEAWDEVDIPHNNNPEDDPRGSNLASSSSLAIPTDTTGTQGQGDKGIEIIIRKAGDSNRGNRNENKRKSTALSPQERQLRQERHKVHVMSLLAMGLVRNRWLNDKELQARLISHLPSPIHASLVSITRERYPNPRDRSRLFETCLKDLTSWWYQTFDVIPGRELKRKSLAETEAELESWQQEFGQLERQESLRRNRDAKGGGKGKGKGKQVIEVETGSSGPSTTVTSTLENSYREFPWQEEEMLSLDTRTKRLKAQKRLSTSSTSTASPLVRPFNGSPSGWEPLSSPPLKSLYAAAANLKGSKDMSVQLFVALLRGLDVPARLVVSLQGMEWRSDSASGLIVKGGKTVKPTNGTTRNGAGRGKGKGRTTVERGEDIETIELSATDSGDEGWQDGRGKLNYKVPKVNLRRSGPTNQKKMANWQKEKMLMRSPSPDSEELNQPPTQWIEAYSRYLKEWVTLDPVRKLVRCKTKMEPTGKAKGSGNSLVYVVGFEEDGSAHDITPRYTKSFNLSTIKLRVPTSSRSKKDNGGKDWFATVLEPWGRKFDLNRDKLEQEELWSKGKRNEPFPTSFGGFKNHPNFVLEQHLHRDEALITGTKPLGLFKATTPVYPRSAVLIVKSLENWYRIGRSVRDGEIPRKFVKGRTVTINSKRREELIKLDGGEVDDQPLFSEDQTELYVPDPVVDGKVPKNAFGNVDLFVPTMLPQGSVHLPFKLAAKCAKMLQIDYAEAIVGFEFRQRRATPTMSGIVVAADHAETLREAIANLEQQSLEKTLAQQQDRVFKRWKKLITGLRIRQRLQGQFRDVESGIVGEAANVVATASAATSRSASATGTPRIDISTSASASPAPNPRKRSNSTKVNRKRSSSRRSPSLSSRGSSEEGIVLPSPPPRKKKRPSNPTTTAKTTTTTNVNSRPARATRSSRPIEPENNQGQVANRSLRIRLPAFPSTTAATSLETTETGRRPTRASALKAKQNLADLSRRDLDEGGFITTATEPEEEQKVSHEEVDIINEGHRSGKFIQEDECTGRAAESERTSQLRKEEQAENGVRDASTEVPDDSVDDQAGNALVEEDDFGFEYESD